jgi:hypothetical protein
MLPSNTIVCMGIQVYMRYRDVEGDEDHAPKLLVFIMSFHIYPVPVPIVALTSCPATVLCPAQYLSSCYLSSLGLEPMQQTDILTCFFYLLILLKHRPPEACY